MPAYADLDVPVEAWEEGEGPAKAALGVVLLGAAAVGLLLVAAHGLSERMERGGWYECAQVLLLLLCGLAYACSFAFITSGQNTLVRLSAGPYLAPLKVLHTRGGRLPRLDQGLFHAPGQEAWEVEGPLDEPQAACHDAGEPQHTCRPERPPAWRVRPCR